jgi:hypothetical protein
VMNATHWRDEVITSKQQVTTLKSAHMVIGLYL